MRPLDHIRENARRHAELLRWVATMAHPSPAKNPGLARLDSIVRAIRTAPDAEALDTLVREAKTTQDQVTRAGFDAREHPRG